MDRIIRSFCGPYNQSTHFEEQKSLHSYRTPRFVRIPVPSLVTVPPELFGFLFELCWVITLKRNY